ncbi:gfo/Idh/MocA family oxidoreductase [Candidatus Peregrinibacteria bacterium CG10_big_fil_rev_8_21_14_0_10_42_8]|nr:MAG: gfo/Idh/MocA family oxidoreductase [Candidatus Peregrinibacteria bacterium CG10_big_fil_rev_8_21_14_0_10_42_8]
MKILIVGLGSIARQHIAALRQLQIDPDVYALRSELNVSAEEGITNIYSLVEAPQDLDFIIISNPTYLHLQTIQKALTLHVPLFIEKPVLRHVSEIVEIEDVSVSTYIACQMRHHPCLQYVKDNITGRTITDIQIYCGSYMPEWVPGIDFKNSFRANTEMSGGVHLELIHEMDYCYWLFGSPNSLQSDLRQSEELILGLIDDARYDLAYDGFNAHIEVNYLDRKPRRTLDIIFDDGQWNVNLLNFTISENGEEIFSSDMTRSDLFAAQMQYFLNCIHSGIKPMNSVQEASKVLTLALS